MAYKQSTIVLTEGDTLPPVELTVYDIEHAYPGKVLDKNDPDTWGRINLSKVEYVTLLLRNKESYADPLEIPCKISNPLYGRVLVEWREGDLDTPGEYEGRLQVYYRDYENEEQGEPLRVLKWTAKNLLDFEIESLF